MHEEETMNEEQQTHSFGGRSLDRYVYEFEVPEGGAGDLGALGGSELGAGLGERDPAAAAVVDPAAAAADPAGAGGEELEPEPLSAEELQQMIREESGGAIRELLEQAEWEDAQRRAAAQQPQAANLPDWDPFNPEVVQQHIMASLVPVFEQINNMLAPALEGAEQYTQDQGKAQAHSLLDGHVAELGEFDKDRAIRDAAFMLREAESSGRQVDPEQVLLEAAKNVREYEERIGQAAIAKFTGQAENLGNASVTPAGGATAGEVVQLPRGKDAYRAQLERSLANRGLAKGVGAGTG